MHFYQCYQQIFISDLRLSIPELNVRELQIDPASAIHIRLNEVGQAAPQQPEIECSLHEFAYLNAMDVGIFVVSHGSSVDIYPLAGVSEAILEMWVLGVVMSTLMYQRGFFTLHACAMQIGGKTVALIGDVGYGKSTLTASLLTRGHGFLADDLAVLDFSPNHPCVLPGVPIIKLSLDIAELLGWGRDRMISQHPYKSKSIYQVDVIDKENVFPIDHLIMLDRGPLEFTSLSLMESFSHLNLNSLPTARGFKSTRQHFERCMRISKNIPFTIFSRPFNVHELKKQAKYLEDFLEYDNGREEMIEPINEYVSQ